MLPRLEFFLARAFSSGQSSPLYVVFIVHKFPGGALARPAGGHGRRCGRGPAGRFRAVGILKLDQRVFSAAKNRVAFLQARHLAPQSLGQGGGCAQCRKRIQNSEAQQPGGFALLQQGGHGSLDAQAPNGFDRRVAHLAFIIGQPREDCLAVDAVRGLSRAASASRRRRQSPSTSRLPQGVYTGGERVDAFLQLGLPSRARPAADASSSRPGDRPAGFPLALEVSRAHAAHIHAFAKLAAASRPGHPRPGRAPASRLAAQESSIVSCVSGPGGSRCGRRISPRLGFGSRYCISIGLHRRRPSLKWTRAARAHPDARFGQMADSSSSSRGIWRAFQPCTCRFSMASAALAGRRRSARFQGRRARVDGQFAQNFGGSRPGSTCRTGRAARRAGSASAPHLPAGPGQRLLQPGPAGCGCLAAGPARPTSRLHILRILGPPKRNIRPPIVDG